MGEETLWPAYRLKRGRLRHRKRRLVIEGEIVLDLQRISGPNLLAAVKYAKPATDHEIVERIVGETDARPEVQVLRGSQRIGVSILPRDQQLPRGVVEIALRVVHVMNRRIVLLAQTEVQRELSRSS